MDKNEIFIKIKDVLKEKMLEDNFSKVDVGKITEQTDLRQMGIDSLDIISFRFAIDEVFTLEIPDEDYESNDLSILGNLAGYISRTKT